MTDTLLSVKNNASSTLDGGINDAVTSLDVQTGEGTNFPVNADCPFHISIDDEILEVTAVSTDTFTVTRGAESTTPASHADDADVELLVTAEVVSEVQDILEGSESELTLDASGAITVTGTHHTVDTYSDAASDNLDTISGLLAGRFYFLRPAHTDRTVVVRHGQGNIYTFSGDDVTMDSTEKGVLIYSPDGSDALVIGIGGDLSAYVAKSLFDAQTVLAATTDDTPAALTVNEQTVVGRLTGGNVAAISMGISDNNMVQVDGSPNSAEVTVWTASGVDGKTYAEFLALLFSVAMPENVGIELDFSLSADGKYSGIVIPGTAGATLAFGDLCYFAVADSRWELADADAEATTKPLLGMCVLAAAGDGSATKMLLLGTIRADTAFPAITVGAPIFVDVTAGDITHTAPTGAGDCIRCIGQGIDGNSIYFCPSPDWFEHA